MNDDTEVTRIGRVAARVRLTEGQLYTVVLSFLAVALLLLTALPGAGERLSPSGTPTTVPTLDTGANP